MHVKNLLSSGLYATTVFAFQDTSPFFMLSTSKLSTPPQKQIATSEQIMSDFANGLSDCPSDLYILAFQPQISSEDFQDPEAAKHLNRRAAELNSYIVPEVIGSGLKEANAVEFLQSRCSAGFSTADIKSGILSSSTSKYPQIVQVDLPSLPISSDARRTKLAEHDSFLNAVVNAHDGRSYTLIYHGTPPPQSYYAQERPSRSEQSKLDFDFGSYSPEAQHLDLKREVKSHVLKRQSESDSSNVALFEKYNFLSPGIFMGGLALLLLFSIGSVGISALSSVEVSYAAFSKEMGPSAQKKQQ